ncbi:YodC family protein [Hafnia alvei]|uniref:YodC family protein n=1 Tax=Hafnia alvei TaxID=569 RepID=UPI001033CA1C|nr:DUF2158 domain-containing protein [Hafnia alvei]TBL83554.1 DUF2158 domain-containing protein [Hafnia alvei]
MSFSVGDSVQKTSGGPRMTVVAVSDNEITCSWNELGNEKQETITASHLALYQEDGDFGVC